MKITNETKANIANYCVVPIIVGICFALVPWLFCILGCFTVWSWPDDEIIKVCLAVSRLFFVIATLSVIFSSITGQGMFDASEFEDKK